MYSHVSDILSIAMIKNALRGIHYKEPVRKFLPGVTSGYTGTVQIEY